MAFEHPHQLTLKRRHQQKGKSCRELPMHKDRRGRTYYRWDAYFVGSMNDPDSPRKLDVWELAEYLDVRRREIAAAEDRRKSKHRLKLAQVKIEESGHGED